MMGVLSKSGLILILLIACTHIPFLNQAFHVDDRFYLEVADNILRKPLFPYDFPAVYEGFLSPDAGSHSHLPLLSYYLAFAKIIAPAEREWIYHLVFLVFPVISAFAFYDLAKRYVRFPLAAACALVLAPAFLVLSHTLMPDVPLLAFWLLAISRFVRLVDGGGTSRDWSVCAIGILGAAFISLLSFGLLLLLGSYWLLRRRSEQTEHRVSDFRVGVLFVLPLLLWAGWHLLESYHYGRFVLANTFLHMNQRSTFAAELLSKKGLSFILNIGGTALFPLAFWYSFAGRASLRVFMLIVLLTFVPFYIWISDWSLVQVSIFAFLFSTGLLVFWTFCRRSAALVTKPEPGWVMLVLWFLGIAGAALIVFYAGSVRYSSLALPPVILLWQHSLEQRIRETYLLRNLIWLTIALTACLSVSLSYADYQFAEVYRTSAESLNRDYRSPDRQVWFTGEWGFRYYMRKNGARILLKDGTEPQPGDVIVKPYVAMPWVTVYDGDGYTHLLEQRAAPADPTFRILDFSSRAGFYSTGWGILPYSLRNGERWEWFNVFRVEKPYTGPVPKQERPW